MMVDDSGWSWTKFDCHNMLPIQKYWAFSMELLMHPFVRGLIFLFHVIKKETTTTTINRHFLQLPTLCYFFFQEISFCNWKLFLASCLSQQSDKMRIKARMTKNYITFKPNVVITTKTLKQKVLMQYSWWSFSWLTCLRVYKHETEVKGY